MSGGTVSSSPAKRTETFLLTHHVEEIPPGFNHIALMSRGRIVASGRTEAVLTGESLSECYDEELRVERIDGRYRAWLAS